MLLGHDISSHEKGNIGGEKHGLPSVNVSIFFQPFAIINCHGLAFDLCVRTEEKKVKALANPLLAKRPLAKDSLSSYFASGGQSPYWFSIQTLHVRGLFVLSL